MEKYSPEFLKAFDAMLYSFFIIELLAILVFICFVIRYVTKLYQGLDVLSLFTFILIIFGVLIRIVPYFSVMVIVKDQF
jgi:uncharacterized RDD family membrane protein YckC